MEWLTAQAAAYFRDLPDHVRTILVQLYRNAQGELAPTLDVSDELPAVALQPARVPRVPVSAVAPGVNPPDNAEPVMTGNSATQSGYRGVYPYGKRWQAVMTVNRQRVRLGTYASPLDAAKAYDLAVRANGGETTNRQLNFAESTTPAVLQPYIDRLARGEAFSRAEFAEFERASLIYDASQAGKGPVDFTRLSAPLVIDEPPRRLRIREDARIVIPAVQADDPTDADADDGA